MNVFALAAALGVRLPSIGSDKNRKVEDPNSPESREKMGRAEAQREKRRQKALKNAPAADPTEAAPFERLAGTPQRTPPYRPPVPSSFLLRECAEGIGDFHPELQGLIAPLVDVESAEAQYICAGYAMSLPVTKGWLLPYTNPQQGKLRDRTLTLVRFIQSFDSILVDEAAVALEGRAEKLIELLDRVSQEDDVPCDRDLALDICRIRSETAMLEIGLRVYGRPKSHSMGVVDAMGVGRLPWLRDAIGDSTAGEADRWSEALVDSPEAWWAAAMLVD